ncbi:MD-2-related lipid-recognition protein-like [Anticarsia gemmatalis]|uniref:MD-2-related lipid-recognition protein-like n=1 Tax=Anticarsia gemmatalis TaxID=129554 RepID=UPI003F769452
MKSFILLVCISFVVGSPEYVNRKLCKDVDATQCTVHSVIVDPCPQGPAFCTVKTNKNYAVTLDMVPHFSASKLKLSVSGDVDNSGNFTTSFKAPADACSLLYCPLKAEERRIFDVYMMFDKRAAGKFPVKIKLWNEQNDSQACCVTLNVKVK